MGHLKLNTIKKDISKSVTTLGLGSSIHKAHVLTTKEIESNRSKAYQYIF